MPATMEYTACNTWSSSRLCGGLLRRKLGVVLALVIFMPFFLLMTVQNPDLGSEQQLVERVAELRERLVAARSINAYRLEDIAMLANRFNALIPIVNGTVAMRNLSASARTMLDNMANPGNLRLPSIYSYLPYLLNDPRSTSPAYMLSRGRTDATIVLGIPTVKREVQSYLMATLRNLIDSMSPEERNTSLIVVLVAESDIDYVHRVASLVERNFAQYVVSGLIDVISPPASFYPDFSSLKPTLGDPIERVRWRTKQNLDFAFLMMYSQSKGVFYVQLEDDVQTKPGYISTMKKFALKKTAEYRDWFVLDFCLLGFIGKMFKCVELPYLVQFFLMFCNDKPVDWLLDYLVQTMSCNLDKDTKHCKKAKDKVWIRYKPSLFQHVGTHSSLKGKVQKLKDKQFGKVQLFFPHINPPATVATNVKSYKSFTFDKAYKGESYFWGLLPQQGDEFTITFTGPTVLTEFLFRSGNLEHPSDRLYNTTVEVLLVTVPLGAAVGDGEQYTVVGDFDDLGVAQGTIDASLGPVRKLRLRVHSESDNWAILSEIHIKTADSR